LLAGDRIDAMYGFKHSAAVAHFATARPKEPGQRFGVQIFGSKGRIDLGFGWVPPARLLLDPTWSGAPGSGTWTEITSGGPGKPETVKSNDLVTANKVIMADLIRAVETDTQPRVNLDDAVGAVGMVLACYASQSKGGLVPFPLTDRTTHPLESLGDDA
jgi:predicted dehydrogenase